MLEFVIPLHPITKKNSNIKTKTGIIPSNAYRAYERDALRVIPPRARRHIDVPVNVCAVYYMAKRIRVDLTNLLNATDDVLVKAGVLSDDNRNIVAGHDGSRVYHDPKNPRTEITITALDGYEQWGGKRPPRKKKGEPHAEIQKQNHRTF